MHPTIFGQATAVKKSREIEMVTFSKPQGALVILDLPQSFSASLVVFPFLVNVREI